MFEDDLKISLYEAWLDFIKAGPKVCSFLFTSLCFPLLVSLSLLFRRYIAQRVSHVSRTDFNFDLSYKEITSIRNFSHVNLFEEC